MTGGNIITARIITGCIITGRAPKLINDGDKIDILNLAGRLYEKTRLSKKEEFEFTCEDLKPKCVEGNVEKAECKKDQSTNRLYFDISVKDCKEIIDKQKGEYIVSTGYAKGYLEISTKVSQGIGDGSAWRTTPPLIFPAFILFALHKRRFVCQELITEYYFLLTF